MRASRTGWILGAAAPLAALAVLGAPAPAAAQDASRLQMGVAVAPETVTVGDPVRVVVRVRAPRGARMRFPGVDSVENVEALDPPRVTGSDTGAVDRTATYRIVAWDTGTVAIPLGDVIVEVDGERRELAIEGASVYVRTVLPADTTLHVPKPARDLISAPAPWWKWWLIAAAAALLLALLLWAWWRRRRRRGEPVPVLDPHAVAEREFARIEGLGLVDAGERERYVALMIEVLRDYLARRVPAARAALTTGELLAVLRGDPRVPAARLTPVLHESDLVKFAAAPVNADRAREIGRESRAIVEQVEKAAREREAAAAAAASKPPASRRAAA